MVRYLLEVFAFQVVFLVVYQMWLRKETFFDLNRAYLIGSALLAFILPFMQFELFQNQIAFRENINLLPEVFINTTGAKLEEFSPKAETDWSIYWLLYAAGVFFSTGMLFRKYLEVKRYFRFRNANSVSGNIIEIPNSDAAFTFLGTIFIGKDISTEARKHILAHEEVHLKQHHGLDLILFEILRVVFWFNPLVYIYQRKVAELHEFIADSYATRKTEVKSYYNQLLNTAFGTQEISFINTFFNQSLIKKRIIMLTKKSKSKAKWKYLFLIPVIAGILTYVGCSDESAPAEIDEELLLQEILDTKDNLSEKDISMIRTMLFTKASETPEGSTPPPPPPPPADWPVAYNTEAIFEVVDAYRKQHFKIEAKTNKALLENVPYAYVEEVPTYPGCESLSGDEKKKCMSQQISAFVNKNYNTDLGKELGLTGINRIYVRFKINKNGEIVDVKSRASHPKLEEEAIRVIEQLPLVTPGKQNGEAVDVMYSLPIVFQTT